MWTDRLRNNYGSYESFEYYDEAYSLAARLGFSSAREAWNANPLIQGDVRPERYKIVEIQMGTACLKPIKGTIKGPDGTESSVESLEATQVGDEFWPKGLQPNDFRKAAEFYYKILEMSE
jgi:hypothetical protein